MFCNKCGRELENDAVFCDYCGEKVSRGYQIASKTIGNKYEEKKEETPQTKNKRSIIVIISLLLCGGIVIALTALIISKSHDEYFKSFLVTDTFMLSVLDNENGNITENGFWVSEGEDRLLIFKKMYDSNLKKDIQYGMYLFDSGKKKEFTEWSIENDKTLTLCFDKISGETNNYKYSKNIENDTWYYNKSEGKLRIGKIIYQTVAEDEVITKELEDSILYDYQTIAGVIVEDENGYRY